MDMVILVFERLAQNKNAYLLHNCLLKLFGLRNSKVFHTFNKEISFDYLRINKRI